MTAKVWDMRSLRISTTVAISGIVAVGFVAHLAVLLSDYVLWDGWSYRHWLEQPGQTRYMQQLFQEVGRPLDFLFLIPFVGTPHVVVLAKVAGVVTWIGASCLMYLVLIRTRLASPNAALMCAAIAVVLPVFDVLGDVSIWMNTACVALFWAGWWLVAAKPSKIWSRAVVRAAALAIFFLSFNLNSQLVLFYAFALCAVALPRLSDGVSAAIDACRRALLKYPDLAVLPVLFWIWKRLFTPNSGYYLGYNNPTLSLDALVTGGHSLWVGLLGAEAMLLVESSAWVAASIAVVIFVGVLAARARWVWPVVGNSPEFGRLLSTGLVLLIAGAFPYAVVGQPFQSFGWLSRNCILFPLPIALTLVGATGLISTRLAPNRPGVLWTVTGLICLLSIGSGFRTALRLQGLGAKQESVIAHLQPLLQSKPLAVLQIRDYFLLPGTIAFYPPIIWTHVLARGLETPRTFVLETAQIVPDQVSIDNRGREQRIAPALDLSSESVGAALEQTTMPYAMPGLKSYGPQKLAIVLPGLRGNDPVTLGWEYLWRRWLAPQSLSDWLSGVVEVRVQDLPDIPSVPEGSATGGPGGV